MQIKKIISGGWCAGHRTYIVSAAGILSAIAAYLAGDINIFNALETIFTLGGIFFLRSGLKDKRTKNGHTRKVSK